MSRNAGTANKKRVRDREKMREYNRKYNATDKARAARKRWEQSPKGRLIRWRLDHRSSWPTKIKRMYGITVEDYAWMMHSQGFACAICRHPFSTDTISPESDRASRERPNVDHCHSEGRVRGLLCGWCNYKVLGLVERVGLDGLSRALDYLGKGALR